ncbi:hypothetical protein BHM03_00033459 [Ensete ventricosum]|nr:hypothetical protein BHM03_00033459 [Ensete ventricosum]
MPSYPSTTPVVLAVRHASAGKGVDLTCVRSVIRPLGCRPYLCQVDRTIAGAPILASDQLPASGQPRRRASCPMPADVAANKYTDRTAINSVAFEVSGREKKAKLRLRKDAGQKGCSFARVVLVVFCISLHVETTMSSGALPKRTARRRQWRLGTSRCFKDFDVRRLSLHRPNKVCLLLSPQREWMEEARRKEEEERPNLAGI